MGVGEIDIKESLQERKERSERVTQSINAKKKAQAEQLAGVVSQMREMQLILNDLQKNSEKQSVQLILEKINQVAEKQETQGMQLKKIESQRVHKNEAGTDRQVYICIFVMTYVVFCTCSAIAQQIFQIQGIQCAWSFFKIWTGLKLLF